MALTLRPSDDFNSCLKSLKKKFNVKAASTVIDKVVQDYENKANQLKATQQKLKETERELEKIISMLNRKTAIDDSIAGFLNEYIHSKVGHQPKGLKEDPLILPFARSN